VAISFLTIALVGTLGLLATVVGGYSVAPENVGRHFLLALVSTLFLVMGHSFIMFFLIATGVEMKNLEKEKGWGDSFRRRTVAMKGQVFPVMTGALLLVLANFVLGAAAHTRVIPPLVHGGLGWLTLAVCALALYREWRALGDNNRLIAELGRRNRSGA
jgi:hypothetical protein